MENAFGRLAAIWRIFHTHINLAPEKVESVVLACCALQNFVITHRTLDFSMDTDAYIADGTWRGTVRAGMRPIRRRGGGGVPENAKAVRDRFKEYFNTVGAVEWQERMIALADANVESDE